MNSAERRLFTGLFALVLGYATDAVGAPPAPGVTAGGPQTARDRYREGEAAYAAGHFRDAIEAFKKANGIAPSPALSFDIARAYDRLSDVPNALAWYRD